MSKKKKCPEVLPPSTTGSIPTETIESAVRELAQTRSKRELRPTDAARRLKLSFLSDRGGKATRRKGRSVP
jgi:hypothetical protein